MRGIKNLREVSALFLKLGFISFGGPAAHIAIMEKEIVTRRKWMTREYFLDLIGATNLIPGPNSTEMAIHCGYERAGWMGLIMAGVCFILPSVLITGILAWFYKEYNSLPAIGEIFYGIKPAVIVIILDAVYKFGKKAVKNWQLGILGIAIVVSAFFGMSEIMLILAAGGLGILFALGFRKNVKSFFPLIVLQVVQKFSAYSSAKLFWVFLKIGCVLFGSGYVLFAYLDDELIHKLGWLTRHQLMDAIAVGQFTPGPVLSVSTFIGYQLNGISGALLATVAIFLPSFVFVRLLNPIMPKLRKSAYASSFIDFVNVAAVAIMLAVAIKMGQDCLVDWKTWGIAIVAGACLFFIKNLNSMWVISGAALAGYLLHFVG